MSALLELNDLKKHFLVRSGPLGLGTTTVRAVDGVSFHIDRGETLALAATYSDRTHSQGASSDPGEGSLARRLNGRQLYVWHAVDSEGEGLTG